METDYHDSGDMSADLVNLTTQTDGQMDELHALRDSLGADLVSLIVESGSRFPFLRHRPDSRQAPYRTPRYSFPGPTTRATRPATSWNAASMMAPTGTF